MKNPLIKTFTIAFLFLPAILFGQKNNLTLEEAVRQQFGKFYPEHLEELQWIPNTEKYVYQKNDTLFVGEANNKKRGIFITKEAINNTGKIALTSLPSFHWTTDNAAWFLVDGKYYQIEFKNLNIQLVNETPDGAENTEYMPVTGNIAYTKANNVFIKTKTEIIQVTHDPISIVNGQSISRNEYGISKGLFWSPDGNALAYYTKDESDVWDYPLTDYNSLPAKVKNIKYPMSGNLSEKVSLNVYRTPKVDQMKVAKANTALDITDVTGKKNDQFYITNIAWTPDSREILVAWLNRATNYMRLLKFDAANGKLVKELFAEKDEKWLEPDQAPIFLSKNPTQFLWRSYQTSTGYHNYLHYDLDGKLLGEFATPYEQLNTLTMDESQVFIFCATQDAMNHTLIKGDFKTHKVQEISLGKGQHEILISSNGKYVLDQFNELQIPNRVEIKTTEGKVVKTLLNADDPLKNHQIGNIELGKIVGHDGTSLNYRLIKPTAFDPSKKYPVLVYVYNGPHVQLVNNGYLAGGSLWMNYFAEKGYLVFTIDGRGSANRGKKFEQAIHRHLGNAEMEDQLAGVEWLRKQPYVDEGKMAIHGWSFGGFMTTSLMLRQPGVFKCGVAGGPVLDWSLYEVMYTERYMDTPQENPDGYKENNLSNYVKNLSGPLLMIHGTDDDVVVMQHNMRFLKTCITNNIPVDFFAYPGHAHNVRGKDRVHLMHKILDYVEHELHH